MVQLNSVAKLIRGVTFSSGEAKESPEAGFLPVLRAGNIAERLIIETDLLWIPENRVSDSQRLQKGDIVICMSSGSATVVGKTAVLDHEWSGCVGAFCAIIRPVALLSPGFLATYLKGAQFEQWRRNQAQGANIQNLRASELEQIRIPLPPLSEQQRIVEILQEAEAIRRLRAQAEAKTAELIPAMFGYAFGTLFAGQTRDMKRLGELADVQGGIQVTKSRDNQPLKVPYLRVANVQRESLDLSEIKEIGLTEAELERTRLLPGDILVVEGHGNPSELGRASMWNGEIENCTHQNHLIRVRCRPEVDPAYMLSMINSQLGRRHFLTAGNTTSGLNTISTSVVRDFRMPLPAPERVQLFSKGREIARELMAPVATAAAKLDLLTASLSAHAFSGRLTEDWREANEAHFAEEIQMRDAALAKGGGGRVINLSGLSMAATGSMAISAVEITRAIPDLTREQRALLAEIRRLVDAGHFKPYFTAEALAAQMGAGPLRRNPQMVESHLAVLAARGFLIPVSREEQTADTGEYVFGNAWRLAVPPHNIEREVPTGPRTSETSGTGILSDRAPGDSIRLSELERLAAKIEKERALP